MEAESAQSVESPDFEARFRAAVSALHQRAEEAGDEAFPFATYGKSKIELTGDMSVIFDIPGSPTERPGRTQYSIGVDGRMYGAVEGASLSPVGEIETGAVLGSLEDAAANLPRD